MESASPPSLLSKVLGENIPHIREQIFLSLDYKSYKACFEVCQEWRKILKSESFQKKAKKVFEREIDQDRLDLVEASFDGNTERIIQLLSTDMLNINGEVRTRNYVQVHPIRRNYYRRVRPLTVAAGNGMTNAVKLLLERGADPNMTDGWNNTPLHNAVKIWDKDSVRLLLDKGADLNIRNKDGNTPLAVILHEGGGANKEIVLALARMLLDAGAEPDLRDKEKLEEWSSRIESLLKDLNSALDCFSRYK